MIVVYDCMEKMILQRWEIQLKHVYISAESPNTKIGFNNETVGTILFLQYIQILNECQHNS